jgi:hypothetical protein
MVVNHELEKVKSKPLTQTISSNPKQVILIRKEGFNIHKFDTKNKNLPKLLETRDFISHYIDPIDKSMIHHKHRLDSSNYKQPVPKWYNIAWDGYRTVENHSKAMIF